MEKTERQLNLIAWLLDARSPRSLEQIREALYQDQPSDEAFKRMFERDKEEVRALGVVVEVADQGWGDEGYVVRKDETLLPDLGLTPAEHAALMLAAEAWGDGMLGPASTKAAASKLAAAASEAPPVPWIVPHVDVGSPHLAVLLDAISRRKAVRFTYRRSGAEAAEERHVEPHGIRFRSAWYLDGFDRDRGQARVFKVDRIEGKVAVERGDAPDFDRPERTASRIPPPEPEEEARVALDPGVAWWVERSIGTRADTLPDGRVEVLVGVPDADRFVRWVAGLGDAAEVIAPPHLREAIAGHLRAIAEGAS